MKICKIQRENILKKTNIKEKLPTIMKPVVFTKKFAYDDLQMIIMYWETSQLTNGIKWYSF